MRLTVQLGLMSTAYLSKNLITREVDINEKPHCFTM